MFGSPNEIAILGVDTVMWRGARFTAVPVSENDPGGRRELAPHTHSWITRGSGASSGKTR